jgi:hypothetical protein
MKRVIRFATLSVAAAGLFVVLPGCQNRGMTRTNETTTMDRPVRASATFDRAYVATRDSEYVVNPNAAGADRGTVARGTRVFFDTAPGAGDWQQARVEGRGIVYVRPADYSSSTNQ